MTATIADAKLELIVATARKYLDGDASRDAFEAALEDAYDEAATIAELRERLAEAVAHRDEYKRQAKATIYEADQTRANVAQQWEEFVEKRRVAEARATAAERALVERDATIAAMLPAIDDLSYCLFCNEDLWTEEAVKIGLADKVGRHASDCPYLDLPASARLAADVLTAAIEETKAEDMVDADTTLLKIKTRDALGLIKEKRRAAVAAWRAGRT